MKYLKRLWLLTGGLMAGIFTMSVHYVVDVCAGRFDEESWKFWE